MRFAPEYIETVLGPIFRDFRDAFGEDLLDIHFAHLLMLVQTGILDRETAARIASALDALTAEGVLDAAFDGRDEDFFFHLERRLTELCGSDTAGRLHTARSRNDIDMTLYRLNLRRRLAAVARGVWALRAALLEIAGRERATLIPLYTHGQAAQPSTVGHYLLAVVEHLERDSERLHHALETANRCPLGSCAITGTGFPIDRNLTAELLGFDGPGGNTYGGIAAADYLLEAMAAIMVLSSLLGRFVQDLLLWSTNELDYLRLGDGFVQVSSIMPQKRNPVALEHSRALASRAMGSAGAVFQILHNTPFGDVVDAEDDLQPVAASALADTVRLLKLLASVLESASFDAVSLEEKAARHWITLTELADTLVRDHGVAFRDAHRVCSSLVERCQAGSSLAEGFAAAAQEVLGWVPDYPPRRIREILSPRNFVNVRRTQGGPAPEAMADALEASAARLASDRLWLDRRLAVWDGCRVRLRERVRRELGGMEGSKV
jgi:argininosuccinate lyase